MIKDFRFGNYLVEKGLITKDAVIRARLLQRKNNRMIGELAKYKGWLTNDDILSILVMQEETCEILAIQEEICEKFGEIAVKEKYLTKEQVDELLKEQRDSYMYFGEALIKIGAMSYDEVTKQLKEYTNSLIKHKSE